MIIVDVHSHDFSDEIAARAMAGMCRQTEGRLWPAGDGTMANHLDFLERAGVHRAVTCPIATKPTQFDVIFRRAVGIAQGVYGARAQRRLIPFASVHPDDPYVVRHVEAIAAAGLRGVKFHPYYQDFSLADRKAVKMFEAIAEAGLVVECHAGGDISWTETKGFCGPCEIETLLKRVPNLVFIAAHLGGCYGYPPHETDRLLDCGCYVDTSALHKRWHFDEEMRLLRSWPRERILFGTDFPWVNYEEAIAWVKSVRDPSDWELLFGGNAWRLHLS